MIHSSGVQVWLASTPVDVRKSFDTLAEHIRVFLDHDPLSGHLFVFRNRSGERLKILGWDRNGLVLYCKRLERGTFAFPTDPSAQALSISSAQLVQLLAGLRLVRETPAAPGIAPATAEANSPTAQAEK